MLGNPQILNPCGYELCLGLQQVIHNIDMQLCFGQ